jgi:hypothetical protein
MAQHESAHEDSEDRFYAQFDSREVELMTLDELQEAFEAGRIHENTFVCREGESEWTTLAIVAGLGEEEEPEPAPVVETRPPMPSRRPDMPVAAGTRPPMPSRRPEPVVAESRPPMPARRPEMNTVPAQRFQQVAQSLPPILPSTGLSYAPVTSNIDLSSLDADDEIALRPKRRWGLVMAAAAVLALAGGGTVFALNGGSKALASAVPDSAALHAAGSHSQASLSLSNIETKPSEPAAAAPATPEPVAAAAPAAAAPSDAPKAAAPAFSDDMKAALLAADKTRTEKHAKKVKANVAKASAAPRRGKAAAPSAGFKTGGSAYDPLNGKL